MAVIDGPNLVNQQFSQNATQRVLVETWNAETDGNGETVLVAEAIIALGTTHDDDPTLTMTNIDGGPDVDNPKVHEFRVTWSSRVTGTLDQSPLSVATVYEWDSQTYIEDVHVDVNGDGIVNSAGQPVTFGREFNDRMLVVTKNFADHADSDYDAYYQTTNNATFFGRSAGQVKFVNVRAIKVTLDSGQTYWQKSFYFHIRPTSTGWTTLYIDKGAMELDDDGELVNIADANGDPVSEEVLLDGTGHKAAAGSLAVVGQVDLFAQADFSGLGIGTS
jgi:hypothetical protein